MSQVMQESPVIYVEGKAPDLDQAIEESGNKFSSSFYEFKFFMPMLVSEAPEMSDDEILLAAEQSGVFRFLDSPEEDVYSSQG